MIRHCELNSAKAVEENTDLQTQNNFINSMSVFKKDGSDMAL